MTIRSTHFPFGSPHWPHWCDVAVRRSSYTNSLAHMRRADTRALTHASERLRARIQRKLIKTGCARFAQSMHARSLDRTHVAAAVLSSSSSSNDGQSFVRACTLRVCQSAARRAGERACHSMAGQLVVVFFCVCHVRGCVVVRFRFRASHII